MLTIDDLKVGNKVKSINGKEIYTIVDVNVIMKYNNVWRNCIVYTYSTGDLKYVRSIEDFMLQFDVVHP